MRRLATALFTIYCLLSTTSLTHATDYSSTNFKVNNPVIEELGGYSTSSNFRLWSNVPYITPSRATSTSYSSIPGFLGYTGTTTVTTSGGGGGGGGGGVAPDPSKPKPIIGNTLRKSVDFNHDGRVDFIDFSILLYYFDKHGSQIQPFDLNDDGVVDVFDISIFMYYWDGN